ncbi:MAG: hypothetical protein QY326_00820 [Bdellovibrionota bacterium]|nr:MAG: hypothetical protein QY326_00820 [Bdellovibrionota bacterium]
MQTLAAPLIASLVLLLSVSSAAANDPVEELPTPNANCNYTKWPVQGEILCFAQCQLIPGNRDPVHPVPHNIGGYTCEEVVDISMCGDDPIGLPDPSGFSQAVCQSIADPELGSCYTECTSIHTGKSVCIGQCIVQF